MFTLEESELLARLLRFLGILAAVAAAFVVGCAILSRR
jgi:hypothetical protein